MNIGKSMQARDKPTRTGAIVKGVFTVRNPIFKVAKNRQQYVLFNIKESLTPVRVVVWENQCKHFHEIGHGKQVKLYGHMGSYHGNRQITCASLSPMSDGRDNVSAAIIRLRALIAWLPDPALKRFICNVFQDSEIRQKFITAPASIRHHHAYPGGLVVHSVEVAWQVLLQLQVPARERYIGVVAGLFHDIGKIRTLSTEMTRTDLGQLVDHERLTLDVLSSPLQSLKTENMEAYLVLANLLSWKPSGRNQIPEFVIYESIRMADRVSAGMAVENGVT